MRTFAAKAGGRQLPLTDRQPAVLDEESSWAIVLAAGEGSRLRPLTTRRDGRVVPKQFCSLSGGRTLLGDALERARAVVPAANVVAIVAAEHRVFWEEELEALPSANVVVQPRNRGTAAGLLLPLLSVIERCAEARVAVLPSDHHVRSEAILGVALQMALRQAQLERHGVTLLGISPESAVSDYGWIVPGPSPRRWRRVQSFVEKPEPARAEQLFDLGGLWNSFLLAARASALLELYARRLPGLLAALRAVFRLPPAARGPALDVLYARLPAADFSRDVLQGSEPRLRVLEVPPCGWTDLGTPRRVAQCLRGQALQRRPAGGLGRAARTLADALQDLEFGEAALADPALGA